MHTPQPNHEPDTQEAPPSGDPPSHRKSADIRQLADLFNGPVNIRSIALTGIFLYMSFFVLSIAKAIFLPICLALILSLLLAPLVRGLRNFFIPAPAAAAAILLIFVSGVLFGVVQLATPASLWLERGPQALRQVEQKFRSVKQSVVDVGKATQALEQAASLPDEGRPTPRVAVKTESLGGTLIDWTMEFIVGLVSTLILLYFFMASGDLLLEKLVKVLPRFSDKRRAVEIVRGIEKNISTYLLTVTGVNLCLGILIGSTMYVLGMPNPQLWGVMAGILNFIPYVGSIIGLGAITLAATFAFQQVNLIAMVSGSYFLLTALEGNFLTPKLLGKRLTLNPVVVLISVLFWGWLWGALGALLAVPFLASLKIICDHIEPLSPIGEFLGR
ncbi:MAG: AI-2E family transporter [Nitrospirales bacterium]